MKNIDYVNKIVSKKLAIPEATVKKVNSFFWKQVRTEIYSHKETTIFIRGIGTFSHSLKKVRTEIIWLIRRIKGLRNSKKYSPKLKEEIVANYTTYLRTLLKHRNIIILHYLKVNELKKRNKERKKNEQNRKMDRDSQASTKSHE